MVYLCFVNVIGVVGFYRRCFVGNLFWVFVVFFGEKIVRDMGVRVG